VFWLIDKLIEQKVNGILERDRQNVSESAVSESTHSAAAEAKIRYLAGVCLHKVTHKVRCSVDRNIGKNSLKSKIACKLDYKKQRMMQFFRVAEDEVSCSSSSMVEIMYKQGASRGLTIVTDEMFEFFIALNSLIQCNLSCAHFDLHGDQTFIHCRNIVDSHEDILQRWFELFGNFKDQDLEDEIFLTLVLEIFKDLTEHFIRIAFVDALKYFKSTVPRKKKQALRSKITALGDSSEPKKMKK
jgi:hypothetical protein